MRVLGGEDLERLLAPADVIRAVEGAFREHAAGRAHTLPRAVLPMRGAGLFLAMVGSLPRRRALGTKLVTVVGANRGRGLPTLHATYLLTDPETGVPLALMEAGFLTAIRTGAASALAARYLARRDSKAVACFGAGVQARYQLLCLQAIFPVERVSVVGRSPERARAFADRMARELGIPVEATRDRRAAVAGADLVTCATTSPTPVFDGRDARPGTHVDAVGAFRPTTREVDTDARATRPRGGGHLRGGVGGGGGSPDPHQGRRHHAPACPGRAGRAGLPPEAGADARGRRSPSSSPSASPWKMRPPRAWLMIEPWRRTSAPRWRF